MNYRSLDDLSRLSTAFSGKIPAGVELVVGIPRSGMLVASVMALKHNLPLTDLHSFLRNDELKKGNTRTYKHAGLARPQEAKKVLLVDDSLSSGRSMRAAADQVRAVYGGEVLTMVAFAEQRNRDQVDIWLELVEQPRLFEWNILHHPLLTQACLDIDGVLCIDPTVEENDDGPNYQRFLEQAQPLFIPSIKVAHLVTSRLEKYRAATEAWLQRHGVEYGELHMLDLPSAEERRRLGIHGSFKAEVYARHPLTRLFVESEQDQALQIVKASGKPVYCLQTNKMYSPGEAHELKAAVIRKSYRLKDRLAGKAKAVLGKWLPA